jgi:NAD(P)-dependent dehydrogenase (short-subunit alcohol dehydrogenase family)
MARRDLADMAGKTALLTGATSGIGRAAAVRLGEAGAHLLLTGRDESRGEDAVETVEAAGGSAAFIAADLATQEGVRGFAAAVRERIDTLDVLLHNAGVFHSERELTRDGIECTFAVNHLAPFLLTHELVGLLPADGRIVVTSSEAHRRAHLHDDLSLADSYSGMTAYAQSKLANVLFVRALASRLDGPTANAVHPGVIPSSRLTRDSAWLPRTVFSSLRFVPGMTHSIRQGGAPLAYLAAAPDVAEVTGAYFDRFERVSPSRAARDDEAARRLWQASVELTGVESL